MEITPISRIQPYLLNNCFKSCRWKLNFTQKFFPPPFLPQFLWWLVGGSDVVLVSSSHFRNYWIRDHLWNSIGSSEIILAHIILVLTKIWLILCFVNEKPPDSCDCITIAPMVNTPWAGLRWQCGTDNWTGQEEGQTRILSLCNNNCHV